MTESELLEQCLKALKTIRVMRRTPIVDRDFPAVRDRADYEMETTIKLLEDAGIEVEIDY